MKLHVVVGGQYGSEGKGAVTAELVRQLRPSLCVRVAGPNAGHTAYDDQGRQWKLRSVPVGAAIDPGCVGILAAGSEIEWDVLRDEWTAILDANQGGGRRMLLVDAEATLLETHHQGREATEGLVERTGSTGKGIGAARSERIMRQARRWGDAPEIVEQALQIGILTKGRTDRDIRRAMHQGLDVVIEGTQGYGLGLHAGHYPQCTSSDARAIDFLAMAGISPWDPCFGQHDPAVWVVLRTYPIRVAGNSGPMLGETSWEQLGFDPEHTTVTGKVRRVGQWDWDLAEQAVEANGGDNCRLALTFVDYLWPELKGATEWEQVAKVPECVSWIESIEDRLGAPVELLGTGPTTMVWWPR